MDEFGLIDAIRARLMRPREDIVTHIGDDAAILAADAHDSVHSVDVAVEGVHFRRDLAGLSDIGWRAFMAATSDLAAMGATPRAALLSLILPSTFADEEALELVEGVAEAAEATATAVIGGNISAGSELSITTTVIGASGSGALSREGAKVGDGIFVTGTPGAAALGLRWLMDPSTANDEVVAQRFVASWRRPAARLAEGTRLLGFASAAIDISDGLLRDLTHLVRASQVGARIEAAALPRAGGFDELAVRLGADPLDLILGGGEDYELLFTAHGAHIPEALVTRVGSIVEGDGVRVVDEGGREMETKAPGYTHR